MTEHLTIALDAMGGDNAPQIVVEGAELSRQEFKNNIQFIFFGDEARIQPLLDSYTELRAVSRIHHTDDVVSNEEKPAIALRSRRNSSMRLAIDSVAEGRANCVISAGNTGALMAMAKFSLKSLAGVDRPAIASSFPSSKSDGTVMLDLGANLHCTARNIVEFAVLGMVYAKEVIGVKEPSVGILNIGEEEVKGRDELKEAAKILSSVSLPGTFYGFVEGTDIMHGVVDVVATDGFTGNIALKTIEGTANYLTGAMKNALQSSWLALLGTVLARPALKGFMKHMDPRRYNGGMFMGLRGICIKSHGGTDGLGFSHAINVGANMVLSGFNEKVKQHLEATNAVVEEALNGHENGGDD